MFDDWSSNRRYWWVTLFEYVLWWFLLSLWKVRICELWILTAVLISTPTAQFAQKHWSFGLLDLLADYHAITRLFVKLSLLRQRKSCGKVIPWFKRLKNWGLLFWGNYWLNKIIHLTLNTIVICLMLTEMNKFNGTLWLTSVESTFFDDDVVINRFLLLDSVLVPPWFREGY